jgi:hypothetical protein
LVIRHLEIRHFSMNELFRNTLGPGAWTIMALVPLAIFALYFLRLRREPLEVPSTYLWTKVIEDLHVNSLWQKLRRNLLLFLQLLLVGLAMLALLRPGWRGDALEGKQFIFLVDRSASMSAADAEGETRLEAAKRRIADLIEQLDSEKSAMIIAFDEGADVVQELTSNRRLLRQALARIEPSAKGTDIRTALELAAGFASPQQTSAAAPGADDADASPEATTSAGDIELYILSDGRFGPVEDFSLGRLKPKYLPIGAFETANVAITAFNARRSEIRPERRQAFVQVANFGDKYETAAVTLYFNGEMVDAVRMAIPSGDAAGATFSLGEADEGVLEARLDPSPDVADGLALDNRAYAVLDRLRQARVLLVTPGNRALELGLATERIRRFGTVEKMAPDVLSTPEFHREMQAETYDLVIFDQCAPEKPEHMPRSNTLFIGRLPPLETWQAKSSNQVVALPQIIDWQRAHPLLNLVELGNVTVADSLIVESPVGGKSLVDSNKGPLAAIAPRDSYEDAVIGFEIVGRDEAGATTVNTNWPRRHSFPNFCLNVVEYLAGGAAERQFHDNKPGQPVEIELPPGEGDLTVTLPDGSSRSVESPLTGRLAFHEADQLGLYEVRRGDRLAARFAVNLFDRRESDVRLRARQDSDVRTVQAISIGYDDITAQPLQSPVRKELWTWLLLAALVVLVLEWYIYNRRVYV